MAQAAKNQDFEVKEIGGRVEGRRKEAGGGMTSFIEGGEGYQWRYQPRGSYQRPQRKGPCRNSRRSTIENRQ